MAIMRGEDFKPMLRAASYDAFGAPARAAAGAHADRCGLRRLVSGALPVDAAGAAAVRLAQWVLEATAVPRTVREDRAATRIQATQRGRATRARV